MKTAGCGATHLLSKTRELSNTVAADPIPVMDVNLSTTSHGIRVVSSRIPHVQSVAMGLWVNMGSRREPLESSGICHFIEHLLFKGTQRRSARDISVAIEGRGGDLNAFTSEENTCYYARVSGRQLDRTFDVLSDMIQHSVLGKDDVEKERQVILDEILMYQDQPRHVLHEKLSQQLWPDHPLGRPITGTPETLASMRPTQLRRFLRDHYTAQNTVVSFSGQVEHEQCVALVERMMPSLPSRAPRLTADCVDPRSRQIRSAFLSKEMEQTQLALGIRLFGYDSDQRHALRVLSAVLGENMSSRLFQIVREKHGLAYSVHSSVQLFAESGALVIGAGLDRKHQEKALRLIVKELVRLKERPVGAAELKRAKDYVTGQLQLGLESTLHQMMWLGENMVTRGRVISPEEVIAKISDVNAEAVQRLARQVLRQGRTSLTAIIPNLTREDERGLKACLREL